LKDGIKVKKEYSCFSIALYHIRENNLNGLCHHII